ncbi:MAG: PASTA domain-containing protein [Armatimonadetes bacterium]|nr:PASTA domain-containing protein [Armatimonadota bacterium]
MVDSTVGNYKITEKLGEGGFGVVYKAVHRLSEQEVAIKTIDSVLTMDPKFRDRFFAEARIQARLKHPNIVVMHNFFEHESRYYIVLEYMEGLALSDGRRVRTLADLIRQGPLPEDKLVELFRQMLSAIGYAHEHGILHRDIKPLNMLFSESGAVKVADFGIAKMVGGETSVAMSGARVGTPAYMSPEQVFDKKLTRATDIYSLGCTLYEAATGKLPFKESDTSSLFEAHVSDPPVPPRQVNPRMSERLETVILKTMQKKPADRFGTCEEFAAALGQGARSRIVVVPRFCGQTRAEAETLARQVGLKIELGPEEYADSTAAGEVLRQEPELGALLAQDSAVRVVVSRGSKPKPVPAPDLIGKQRREAEVLLASVGLKLTAGREVFSKEVNKGAVVEQSPACGVLLEPGDAVGVVLSSGPRPVPAPALGGMTLEEARRTAAELELRIEVSGEEPSEYVAAGRVVRQSPVSGVPLPEGDVLRIALSLGVPERRVEVPDVRGKPREEAERLFTTAQLLVKVVGWDYSDRVPAEAVLSQEPRPGALSKPGETVGFVLSRGRRPALTIQEPVPKREATARVTVPSVVGKTRSEAEAIIRAAGYAFIFDSIEHSDSIPKDAVIRQTPEPEHVLPIGRGVKVVLSGGRSSREARRGKVSPEGRAPSEGGHPGPAAAEVRSKREAKGRRTVPSVVGKPRSEAEAIIRGAGFGFVFYSTEYSDTIPDGAVTRQMPEAGISLPAGRGVKVVLCRRGTY